MYEGTEDNYLKKYNITKIVLVKDKGTFIIMLHLFWIFSFLHRPWAEQMTFGQELQYGWHNSIFSVHQHLYSSILKNGTNSFKGKTLAKVIKFR